MKSAVTGMVVILMAGTLFGQVHIRENVRISPRRMEKATVEAPTNSVYLYYPATITVTVTGGYDDLCDPNTQLDIILFSPVSESIITTSPGNSGVSWTSSEYEAGTAFEFGLIEHHTSGLVDTVWVASINPPTAYDPSDTVFNLVANGQYSNDGRCYYSGYGAVYFRVTIHIKTRVDRLDVNIEPNPIDCLSSATVKVTAMDAFNREISVPDFGTVYLKTNDNRQFYCSLLSPEGTRDWFMETTYGEAHSGKIKLLADGPSACYAPTVQVDAWTVFIYPGHGQTPVTITPPTPDHFYVYTAPDEIEHSAVTTLFVQAKDTNDMDMEFNGDIWITTSPPEYGELFLALPTIAGRTDINGKAVSVLPGSSRSISSGQNTDTSAVKPMANSSDFIANYWSAYSGNVLYIADGRLPEKNTTVTFTVTAVDFPKAVGIGSVVLKDSNRLRLTASVVPEEVRPLMTGGNNKVNVTVFAALGDKPAAGIPIRLEAKAVEGTGGHDHDGNRPVGTFSPNSGTTDETGEFKSTYIASQFGGRELIITSTSDEEVTNEIEVKVNGLVPLTRSDNLLTYTSKEADKVHSLANSNWGTSATNTAIREAAGEYAFEYGMATDVYLAVIDMSLPWGGLFDMNANWRPSHILHRVGNSVDFSRFYRNNLGKVITVGIYFDDKLIESTTKLNDDRLDAVFDLMGFERKEKELGLIHYELKK